MLYIAGFQIHESRGKVVLIGSKPFQHLQADASELMQGYWLSLKFMEVVGNY